MTLTSFSRSHQHLFDPKKIDLNRLWWPWPNFQGHQTIKTVKMSIVCTLSPEPSGGFWPTCTETPLGYGKDMIRFWWPWPHFQGHNSTLNVKFWLVCTLSVEPNDEFWTNLIGIIKKLIRFWWHWPNIQGYHTVKTVKISLVCTLSTELIGVLGRHSVPQKT